MRVVRTMIAALALAAGGLSLGGCMYDDYGYGGLNVGYGTAGGYGAYDDGYYGYPGAAYGYGSPAYGYGSGCYNDFYYPGSGYYVFDRSGRRSRWNDGQRRYWQQRRAYGDGRRFDPGRGDRPVYGDRGRYRQNRPDGPGRVDRPYRNGRPNRGDYRPDRPSDRPIANRPPPRIDGGRGNGRGGLLDRVERRVQQQQ